VYRFEFDESAQVLAARPIFVLLGGTTQLPRVSARSASRSYRSAKRIITAAVLLSFNSFDDPRISAARSRRWFDSLTYGARITDSTCYQSNGEFVA
jgi:hypothetical protein